MGTTVQRIGALLLMAGIGTITAEGCVLKIGPGGTREDDAPPAEGTHGESDGPEEPSDTPSTSFGDADPKEVALAAARAGYTMYMVQGLIESHGLDPDTVDEQTLQNAMAYYGPTAGQAADTWVKSLDTAALSDVMSAYTSPKLECVADFGCPASTFCEFADECKIVDCGDGRCKPCPDVLGFSKLIIRAWCAYVCVKYEANKESVVGIAGIAYSSFGDYELKHCIPSGSLW
jgi:hypothetical protein